MSILREFGCLLGETQPAFSQRRVFSRVMSVAVGLATSWGRRTISRAICATHGQFEDWSATYKLFSQSPWDPRNVFQPILKRCLGYAEKGQPFVIALDDTSLKKTGKKIPGVGYSRDPMSPPFHTNLRRAQRFIQASAIVRPEGLNGPARGIPIRFHPAPPPAKPGRKADEAALDAYRIAKRTENLSCRAVELIRDMREHVNAAGYVDTGILLALDGSYCNRTVLRNLPEKVEAIARARGDIKLFKPPADNTDEKGRKRKYGDELPKPKDIRTNDDYPWMVTPVFGAGRIHNLKHKVVENVLWRSGTLTRKLRLIIIAPLAYRPTLRSRVLYRDPAYLLTTDLVTPINTLIQAYFDRWEIEVNHRDEKDLLGVGDAQVWSEQAAYRVPQFLVAVYSMLLLASLEAYGPRRTNDYLPLPKWRNDEARRPSFLDILGVLREQLMDSAQDRLTEIVTSGASTKASRRVSVRSQITLAARSTNHVRTTPEIPTTNPVIAALYAST